MIKIQILSSPNQLTTKGTSFEVSHFLWGTKFAPPVTGRIGYVTGDGFYVEMTCLESDPLRRQNGFQAPVYLDSAMEAFFHFPFPGSRKNEPSPYINLEFNANGSLLAQCGGSRAGRTPLSETECQAFSHRVQLLSDHWTLNFRLPLSLLKQCTGSRNSVLPIPFPVTFIRFRKIRPLSTTPHFPRFYPNPLIFTGRNFLKKLRSESTFFFYVLYWNYQTKGGF